MAAREGLDLPREVTIFVLFVNELHCKYAQPGPVKIDRLPQASGVFPRLSQARLRLRFDPAECQRDVNPEADPAPTGKG